MRALTMAALALSTFTRFADAQSPRAWFVEVSAARVFGGHGWYEDVGHMADDGAAWNATVGRQMRPWLAFTGGRVLVFYEQEGPFLVATLGFGLRY